MSFWFTDETTYWMILENLVVTCGGPRNRGVRGGEFARERMVYRLVNFYHKILKKNPGQTCGLHVVNQEKQKRPETMLQPLSSKLRCIKVRLTWFFSILWCDEYTVDSKLDESKFVCSYERLPLCQVRPFAFHLTFMLFSKLLAKSKTNLQTFKIRPRRNPFNLFTHRKSTVLM